MGGSKLGREGIVINSEGKISFLCSKSPALRAGGREPRTKSGDLEQSAVKASASAPQRSAGLEAGEGGRFLVRAPGGTCSPPWAPSRLSPEVGMGNSRISRSVWGSQG